MNADMNWKGDEPEDETKRRLRAGRPVFSHGNKFVARMDTSGRVRELLNNSPRERHIVDFKCVTGYLKSLYGGDVQVQRSTFFNDPHDLAGSMTPEELEGFKSGIRGDAMKVNTPTEG